MNSIFVRIILLLLLPLPLWAGSIEGTVKDSQGQGLAGVTIQLGNQIGGYVTNEQGSFKLSNIPTGTHQLTFRFLGYKIVNQEVTIKENQTTRISIVMYPSELALQEVVVTAGRFSEKISEMPTTVSVIPSKSLTTLNKNTSNILQTLSIGIPGLASSSGMYTGSGQTLRGRPMLIMVDGVPTSTPIREGSLAIKAVQPSDLERVEVVKGATSIYGNGSEGGYINYVTKSGLNQKPFGGTTELWGTFSMARIKDSEGAGFYQSFSGSKRNLSYYLSGSYEQTGNRYDAHGDTLGTTYGTDNTRIFSLFGKVEYKISANQRWLISSSYYRSRQHTPFETIFGKLNVFDKEGNYQIIPTKAKVKSADYPEEPTGPTSLSVLTTYELKNIMAETSTFAVDAYFQHAKNIFFYSTSFINGGQSVIQSDKVGLRPNITTRLPISDGNQVDIIYGIDLQKDKTDQGLLDGRTWVPTVDFKNLAPFIQANFKLAQVLHIKAGLRYDYMNISLDDYETLPTSPKGDGNFLPSVAVNGGSKSFQNISFNIGVKLLQNQHFIPYANFSQGFSIPDLGRVLRQTDDPNVLQKLDVNAARTNNYELGFQILFPWIRFETVGYYSYTSIGRSVAYNPTTNRYERSLDPQHIFGAEASVDMRFFKDRVHVGSSYSLVEGLTPTAGDKNKLSYIGGDVIAPPKITAYADWQFHPKWFTRLDFVFTGDRHRFSPIQASNGGYTYRSTEVPVKGYGLLYFQLTYSPTPKLGLTWAINNLLNRYYLPAYSQWSSTQGQYNHVGEGINSRISLRYTF